MTAPKFCSSCGAASDGERFCTHCGHQLIHDQTEPAGSTPQDTAAEPEPEPAATATAVREPDPPVQPPRSAPTAAPGPAPQGPPPQMPPSGSQVAAPRSGPPWLAFALSAGIIVVVAAVVAIVLLATSGSPGAKPKKGDTVAVQLTNTLLASRQLYAATPQPTYATLLPAGWTQVSSSDPNLAAAITVKSPVDQGATITVGQIAKPPKTFARRGCGDPRERRVQGRVSPGGEQCDDTRRWPRRMGPRLRRGRTEHRLLPDPLMQPHVRRLRHRAAEPRVRAARPDRHRRQHAAGELLDDRTGRERERL